MPGMDRCVIDHVMGQVARCILAATVLDSMTNLVKVVLHVDIERWNSPMGFGHSGLLLHIEDLVVGIEDDDAGALEFGDIGLLMTHDATGLLGLGEIDKLLETEEEDVVGSNNQQGRIALIATVEIIDGEQQVADSTETGFVGFGTIVEDGDGLGIAGILLPGLEVMGELMVGDDDVLVDVGNTVDIDEHTIED